MAIFFTGTHAAQAQSPAQIADSSTALYFILAADTTYQELIPQETGKEISARRLKTVALVMAGAATWAAAYTFVDEPVQQFMQSHRCVVANDIASGAQVIGRQKYLMPAVGVALAGGIIAKDKKLQQAALISLGSMLANTAASTVLKGTFNRYRPSTTTENHIYDGLFQSKGNSSLPSFHTSTAFAVATSFATVYKDSKYVSPIAYGLATLVGLSRINDNAHWTTDVLAGAAVGYLSSKGVSYLYNRANRKLENRQQKLLLTPQINLASAQLNATLIF
ncbi:phosphatase PAP2 family protein [Pontibacter sp. 172403-2]|uniref:phosphatase PAP2 family protein n=1 Tax=Pontibacter rufus TaxID=2791028 RepID=UPI0018AF85D7|nr:phosphatase PAP2 family protein [Pontibacter sp. 172403-2]MBF9252839.1 phosphatase PAP2 family protein [Pontibacter sp. 172403-2]